MGRELEWVEEEPGLWSVVDETDYYTVTERNGQWVAQVTFGDPYRDVDLGVYQTLDQGINACEDAHETYQSGGRVESV